MRHPDQGRERRLEVGESAHLQRVVPPEFGGIDIDLHELRGRDVEGELGVPGAGVGLSEPRAQREDPVSRSSRLIGEGGPPESRHAQHEWIVIGHRTLAHEAVGDGKREQLGELGELCRGIGGDHSATDIQHRAFGIQKVLHDLLGDRLVEARLDQRTSVAEHPVEQLDLDFGGEDIHGDVDEDGSGPAALREREGLVEHLGDEVGLINTPRTLDERAVDLVLSGVGVKVDLLMWVLPEVVRRDVAGDDDHRDRIQRGVRHPCGGIRQTGTEVREHDPRALACARVPVSRMGGDLLMPHVDEGNLLTLLKRSEQRDVRVAAQTEYALDAACLQIPDDLVRHRVLHDVLLHRSFSCGTERRAGPV